ncbi:MAG: hypothetical protein HDT12_01035, partial [Helicobacter sp.]|nr:hypothetical protein [Helicobacter sp.]
IDEQWRIKDSRIQSGAVLWLRHSFARAFSSDSKNPLSLRASKASAAINRARS